MPEPATHGWRIRRAGVSDAGQLAAAPAGMEITVRSYQAWTAWLGEPATLTLIAESGGGRLSGLLDLRLAADEAEIIDLWVAPPDRRRGVAGGLLDRARSELAATPTARLFLEVAVDNTAACALYEKQGFATVARRDAYYARPRAQPVDALVMVCPIRRD